MFGPVRSGGRVVAFVYLLKMCNSWKWIGGPNHVSILPFWMCVCQGSIRRWEVHWGWVDAI